jgi:protein O-GlcNAc transferase
MQSPENALSQYQQALLRDPKDLDAHIMCGNLCVELKHFEEAAGYFRRIVRMVKSDDARRALCYALEQLGNSAQNAGNFAQAEACFAEALEYQAGNAIHWYNLGNAQRDLGKPQVALQSFKQSILFNPNDADAHNNLGNVYRELGQLVASIASYETALRLNPKLHHALAHLVHQKQHICDWHDLDKQINTLRSLVKTESNAQISPFAFLSMPGTTPQEQLQCASNYANSAFMHLIDLSKKLNFHYNKTAKTKLKIGYLSADFRLHPLAFLITELIENHDKTQFETVAYSYGIDDQTPARKRLVKAFDHFHEIRLMNDVDAATKIHQDGIDILVDLTGYTQSSRTGLVALKPAPISINWLGYPGSMGVLHGESLFDYVIADKVIAPNAHEFSEKIIYLPCYQPNDSARPVGKNTQKSAHNLPENSFVFCCFNQSFKITADVFAAWMHILKAVPNSILWLLNCNQWAKANLQEACEHAEINKSRLIFAPRVPIEDHLARHIHADLFLDTQPYNAHTTASDAIYMGLPVLTCIRDTFASRVAASLLYRINCEDLVTDEMSDYTLKAIELANNPAHLLQIKQQMKQYANECNIFDPAYFMQQLAFEYQKIWKNYINSV